MPDNNNWYLSGVSQNNSFNTLHSRRTQVLSWLRTHKERADASGNLLTPKLDQEIIGLGERATAIDAKIAVLDHRDSVALGGLKQRELAYRTHLRQQLNIIQNKIGIVSTERVYRKAVFAAKKERLENAVMTLNTWMGGPPDAGL